MLKKIAKKIAKNIKPEIIESFLQYSFYKQKYKNIENTNVFGNRESLWEHTLNFYNNNSIILLEFGVHEGGSMSKFLQLNTNRNSFFYGFDSFIGLPSAWSNWPEGSYSNNGKIPEIQDSRVNFIKGWFQNTLPNFLLNLNEIDNLIVHYDADLYSSTLFCLMQIDALKIPYLAIFDEFVGEETRALANYQEITGAQVEFIGKTIGIDNYAGEVSCKISPCLKYKS